MGHKEEYLLRLDGLSKSFPGVKALDQVTLEVRKGTIHALMGENGAGKSTLMKCLFGIYHQDEGQIYLDDKAVNIDSTSQALQLGISMIHQELHPILHRNVMENIWLGRFPFKYPLIQWIDHQKLRKWTEDLFKELNLDIDPKILVRHLSVSKIQQMEIAKAVSYDAKVIIMDEPTSSLTETETAHLFEIIHNLKAKGVSIIYISHKIEEILRIADDVTIMRDGKKVGTWEAKELTTDLIISRMVGRDMNQRFPAMDIQHGDVVMEVKNLTSPYTKSFKDVSFELRKGEILGIGGLVGSQRTELVEAIFGLRAIEKGTITLKGKEVRFKSAKMAKEHKLALLTEERRATGIFPVLPVLDNTVIANMRKYVALGLWLNDTKRKVDAQAKVEQLNVKTPHLKTLMQNLSGGNQQKVLFGRWLLTDPEILILDEPTRGIDVGAKYEIYCIITELAKQGKSIIMISSEMPELLGMSHRIMVMCEGRLTGILDKDQATEEEIMRLATQFTDQGSTATETRREDHDQINC